MPDNPTHDYLNTLEAASLLRLSKSTLDKWRCTGGGPRFSKLGKRVLYALDDLTEFFALNRRPHTSYATGACND